MAPPQADRIAPVGVPVTDQRDVLRPAPDEDVVGGAGGRAVAQDEGAAAAHADADVAVAVPVADQRHVAGLAVAEGVLGSALGTGVAQLPPAVLEGAEVGRGGLRTEENTSELRSRSRTCCAVI